MSKKHKPSDTDLALFREAMSDAKPLKKHKERITRSTPVKRRPISTPFKDALPFSEALALAPVHREEHISFKQASVPHKTLRKLRKGQYTIDAVLDLHGLTVEEALQSVNDFLQQCSDNGVRVALIVHGKGQHSQMPILKNKLNHWLRTVDIVLAFCSAAPTHGSRGAVYVLLKNTAEEH